MDLDWEIRRLRDIPNLVGIMDKNIAECPELFGKEQAVLNGFFSVRPKELDIAFVLDGGLDSSYSLAYYLEGKNLMFFRPASKHRLAKYRPFLIGKPRPQNELLLFENDMVTGNTLRECADFFTEQGYERNRIFAYLEYGMGKFKSDPMLDQVDSLLGMIKSPNRTL